MTRTVRGLYDAMTAAAKTVEDMREVYEAELAFQQTGTDPEPRAVTLIEYLQTAVTELGECNCHDKTIMFGNCLRHAIGADVADALADHVEAMVGLHHVVSEGDGSVYPPICDCEHVHPCPSLRSVARLVAAVTQLDATP